MNALVPDFSNFIDGDIEKITVVRNQDECNGIMRQILFQPVAGFEIEMVGGLIEQQQVWFLQAAAWPARYASANRRKIPRSGDANLPC